MISYCGAQTPIITDFAQFSKLATSSMSAILPAPQGDIRFILRNEEIRNGYSCLHSADAFYIALAEDLAKSGPAEFLTFDKRVVNVAASAAPTVKVNLLT